MILVDIGSKAYRALLSAEPEDGYTVIVPELPGCITYSENFHHAIAMAKEAIELCVETLRSEQQHS